MGETPAASRRSVLVRISWRGQNSLRPSKEGRIAQAEGRDGLQVHILIAVFLSAFVAGVFSIILAIMVRVVLQLYMLLRP